LGPPETVICGSPIYHFKPVSDVVPSPESFGYLAMPTSAL
jgi:hypothetical protein